MCDAEGRSVDMENKLAGQGKLAAIGESRDTAEIWARLIGRHRQKVQPQKRA